MKTILLTATIVTAIASVTAQAHADEDLTGYQPPHVVSIDHADCLPVARGQVFAALTSASAGMTVSA